MRLSGSGATGSPPTTLTPTLLNVEWTCMFTTLFDVSLISLLFDNLLTLEL